MHAVPRCSDSPPGSEPRWPSWLTRAPSLVAESLVPVRDPLGAWLAPPPPARPAAVASALAHALLPPVAADEPPGWLRPDQRLSFRRALAAARRFGGALLADGVGTGKTWIALAVAAALRPGRPIHVLAPAALLRQWRDIAQRAGVTILAHSHETLSRGRAPSDAHGPVLIDESHRFRTPGTRRYETVAPWLVGRRGLLLSATPAVNRLEDVAHQLLLLIADDALAWAGTESLVRCLRAGRSEGLSHVVLTGEDRSRDLPIRVGRELRAEEPLQSPWHELFHGIGGLALSVHPVVAALIRTVLLQALASSPAAIADALRRYRGLLLHAADAAEAGRSPTRRAIRQMVGAEADQLVLWPLLAEAAPTPELAREDLERVAALERRAREWCACPDAKAVALRLTIAEVRPTLVFTTCKATIGYLRAHLSTPRIAWCTGGSAGMDRSRLPRETVLDWFRRPRLPGDEVMPRPRVLLATEVASEGLDLPLVERVVHYDLPWTAVRLEQRSGRAVRLGADHPEVEVMTFRPPATLEAVLRKEAILEAKSVLPAGLGLGEDPDAAWRRSARIAAAWAGVPPREGSARIRATAAGVVAGFRIEGTDGSDRAVVVARTGAGWTEDTAVIAELLAQARRAEQGGRASEALPRGWRRGLSGIVRQALRMAQGRHLAARLEPAEARTLTRRLVHRARTAIRRRDLRQLGLLERGLGFLRRGHSAGESRLIARWAGLPDPALLDAIRSLPHAPPLPSVHRVTLIGVLIMERAGARG